MEARRPHLDDLPRGLGAVVKPYHPSEEEKAWHLHRAECCFDCVPWPQADPNCYARNVRQYMLEKHRELELACRTSRDKVDTTLRDWRRRLQLQKRFVAEALDPKTRLRTRLTRRHQQSLQNAKS
eukprot:Skav205746  [mRNA]  locus=scaffold3116:18119:20998:- [translate_table: standard]